MKQLFLSIGLIALVTSCLVAKQNEKAKQEIQKVAIEPPAHVVSQKLIHKSTIKMVYPATVSSFDYNAPINLAGMNPGKAQATYSAHTLVLRNNVLSVVYCTSENKFSALRFEDHFNGVAYRGGRNPFVITLADGKNISGRDFKIVSDVKIESLLPDTKSTRLSDQKAGTMITVQLQHEATKVNAQWRAILRDDANYIRYEIAVTPTENSLEIKGITLFQAQVKNAQFGGNVEGAPVVTDCFFAGAEHPMSLNKINGKWTNVADDTFIITMDQSASTERSFNIKMPEKYAEEIYFKVSCDSAVRDVQINEFTLSDEQNKVIFSDLKRRTLTPKYDVFDNVLNTNEVIYVLAIPQGHKALHLKMKFLNLVSVGEKADEVPNIIKIALNANTDMPTISCTNPLNIKLQPRMKYENAAVVGIARKGQVRRYMGNYIQQERPYPYRQFLHYNSWYDIGYFTKYSEGDVADVINAYCQELGVKRGIMPKSFLLDDGWDELNSLWDFHSGFPEGFKKIGDLSKSYGSNIGVWLSPFGGYGDPREKRIKAAKEFGYETNESGFALSGPKYYARFLEICKKMMIDYNANMFKFDGLSRSAQPPEGSAFNSDFEAAIALIKELRTVRNDVLINLTTGTWASPFWLLTVDCIYRGGWDHEFISVGTERQQWLNFRDQETYKNVVQRCPTFPINSLMLHGVIFAKHARWLDYDPSYDLASEVRSFFGSGTMLQELYVTPAMMTPYHWDLIAQSAKWALKNEKVMVDMHWVGGEPQRKEIYGFAAWIPNQGVLTLRNPSDQAQTFKLNVREIMQIPEAIKINHTLQSPYADQRIQSIQIEEETTVSIKMNPFEVLVFDLTAN